MDYMKEGSLSSLYLRDSLTLREADLVVMPTLFGQGWPFAVASDFTFEIIGMVAEPVVLLAAISHMIQLWYISQNPKKAINTLKGDTCKFTIKSQCS
jgi:hypothetical protein